MLQIVMTRGSNEMRSIYSPKLLFQSTCRPWAALKNSLSEARPPGRTEEGLIAQGESVYPQWQTGHPCSLPLILHYTTFSLL